MSRSSRRGPWLPEEDTTLILLVRTQGPNNWVRISQHMLHRSAKQCRERYHQNLKSSLNHEPISAQEGEVIEQLVREMGKRWAEIARRLGNRSDNAVKNWWNGSMNRRKRITLQQGHGSKVMGARTHPMPVSLPPSTLRQHLYPPEQSTSELFAGPPPFHRHGVTPPSTFGQNHPYSIPEQPHRHPHQTHSHYQPIRYPHYDQPTTSPNPYSSSSNLLSTRGTTLPKLPIWSSVRPEYQLPPLNCLDPPANSPAATEVSQASSHQPAPSLISDNESNSTISPKTITSPRLGMTASEVPSMEAWPEMQRRNTTGNYMEHEMGSNQLRPYEDDSRTYLAENANHVLRKVPQPLALPRPLSLPDTSLKRASLSTAKVCAHIEHTVSPRQKDFRMTVSRLLE